VEPEEGGLEANEQARIEVRPWILEDRVGRQRPTATISRSSHR